MQQLVLNKFELTVFSSAFDDVMLYYVPDKVPTNLLSLAHSYSTTVAPPCSLGHKNCCEFKFMYLTNCRIYIFTTLNKFYCVELYCTV